MGNFVRQTGRYREIAMALGRHGFGYIVEGIGLTKLLSAPFHRIRKSEHESLTLAVRIRLVLEELGPTFVKVGQLASTRTDLLPADIVSELVKLQDQVPPFSAEEAIKIIENELDISIDELLEKFEEMPLAAASLGQVHKATLVTGEVVAIKVQRPGVAALIQQDLNILKHLTGMAQKHWPWVARYQIPGMVEEFSKSITAELDYSFEGRNTEKIRRQLKDSKGIYIPGIHWHCTSSKVLTMDFVDGIHLKRLSEQQEYEQVDPKEIAERLVNAMLRQIFIGGVFHADPHPGNLLVTPSGDLAFIDFGMVGRLNSEMKDHLASLVISLMQRNTGGMVRAIQRMGLLGDSEDEAGLRMDLERLHDQYYDIPFSEIRIGEALQNLFATAQHHGIVLPPDLFLLVKALLTVEGVALSLDPELRILDLAEPFGRKLLREKYSATRINKKLIHGVSEFAESLSELPHQARRLSNLLSKGKVKVEMDVPELEHILRKMDQIGNRLSFSIVLLAFSIIMVGLIVGSSLTRRPTLLWDFPAIEIGFVVATSMFVWLLYSIYKSGRF